jgi:hypothetical protein
MHRIVKAVAHTDFTLELTFDDGASGCVNVKPRLFGPMFEPLLDPAFFTQASVDEFGAVCWPNNADLAPDTLYAEIQNNA